MKLHLMLFRYKMFSGEELLFTFCFVLLANFLPHILHVIWCFHGTKKLQISLRLNIVRNHTTQLKVCLDIFRHFKAVTLHIIPLGDCDKGGFKCLCYSTVELKTQLNSELFWHFLSVRSTPLLATQKYELIQCRLGPWPWRKCAASAHLPYKEKSLKRSRLWNRPVQLPPRQVAHFSSGRHTLDPANNTHVPTHCDTLWHARRTPTNSLFTSTLCVHI